MKPLSEETHPVLLKIPVSLLEKLDEQARKNMRDRVDEIIFILKKDIFKK